jgi:hypothetical protein
MTCSARSIPRVERTAINEIFHEDAVFYEPNGIHRGRDEFDRTGGAIKATHPDLHRAGARSPRGAHASPRADEGRAAERAQTRRAAADSPRAARSPKSVVPGRSRRCWKPPRASTSLATSPGGWGEPTLAAQLALLAPEVQRQTSPDVGAVMDDVGRSRPAGADGC